MSATATSCALADGGRSDVIYAMNNQSERPGYEMHLARGATSLSEAWDANLGSSQNLQAQAGPGR